MHCGRNATRMCAHDNCGLGVYYCSKACSYADSALHAEEHTHQNLDLVSARLDQAAEHSLLIQIKRSSQAMLEFSRARHRAEASQAAKRQKETGKGRAWERMHYHRATGQPRATEDPMEDVRSTAVPDLHFEDGLPIEESYGWKAIRESEDLLLRLKTAIRAEYQYTDADWRQIEGRLAVIHKSSTSQVKALMSGKPHSDKHRDIMIAAANELRYLISFGKEFEEPLETVEEFTDNVATQLRRTVRHFNEDEEFASPGIHENRRQHHEETVALVRKAISRQAEPKIGAPELYGDEPEVEELLQEGLIEDEDGFLHFRNAAMLREVLGILNIRAIRKVDTAGASVEPLPAFVKRYDKEGVLTEVLISELEIKESYNRLVDLLQKPIEGDSNEAIFQRYAEVEELRNRIPLGNFDLREAQGLNPLTRPIWKFVHKRVSDPHGEGIVYDTDISIDIQGLPKNQRDEIKFGIMRFRDGVLIAQEAKQNELIEEILSKTTEKALRDPDQESGVSAATLSLGLFLAGVAGAVIYSLSGSGSPEADVNTLLGSQIPENLGTRETVVGDIRTGDHIGPPPGALRPDQSAVPDVFSEPQSRPEDAPAPLAVAPSPSPSPGQGVVVTGGGREPTARPRPPSAAPRPPERTGGIRPPKAPSAQEPETVPLTDPIDRIRNGREQAQQIEARLWAYRNVKGRALDEQRRHNENLEVTREFLSQTTQSGETILSYYQHRGVAAAPGKLDAPSARPSLHATPKASMDQPVALSRASVTPSVYMALNAEQAMRMPLVDVVKQTYLPTPSDEQAKFIADGLLAASETGIKSAAPQIREISKYTDLSQETFNELLDRTLDVVGIPIRNFAVRIANKPELNSAWTEVPPPVRAVIAARTLEYVDQQINDFKTASDATIGKLSGKNDPFFPVPVMERVTTPILEAAQRNPEWYREYASHIDSGKSPEIARGLANLRHGVPSQSQHDFHVTAAIEAQQQLEGLAGEAERRRTGQPPLSEEERQSRAATMQERMKPVADWIRNNPGKMIAFTLISSSVSVYNQIAALMSVREVARWSVPLLGWEVAPPPVLDLALGWGSVILGGITLAESARDAFRFLNNDRRKTLSWLPYSLGLSPESVEFLKGQINMLASQIKSLESKKTTSWSESAAKRTELTKKRLQLSLRESQLFGLSKGTLAHVYTSLSWYGRLRFSITLTSTYYTTLWRVSSFVLDESYRKAAMDFLRDNSLYTGLGVTAALAAATAYDRYKMRDTRDTYPWQAGSIALAVRSSLPLARALVFPIEVARRLLFRREPADMLAYNVFTLVWGAYGLADRGIDWASPGNSMSKKLSDCFAAWTAEYMPAEGPHKDDLWAIYNSFVDWEGPFGEWMQKLWKHSGIPVPKGFESFYTREEVDASLAAGWKMAKAATLVDQRVRQGFSEMSEGQAADMANLASSAYEDYYQDYVRQTNSMVTDPRYQHLKESLTASQLHWTTDQDAVREDLNAAYEALSSVTPGEAVTKTDIEGINAVMSTYGFDVINGVTKTGIQVPPTPIPYGDRLDSEPYVNAKLVQRQRKPKKKHTKRMK
jgi:hypothetical protein